MHVKEAQRTLGSGITWLCDTMSNKTKHSLGDAPNSEFVIDPQGKVAVRRAWSDPKQLRSDLEKFVGSVEHVTQVSELNLKIEPPPKVAAKGVVPRLKFEGRFNAVEVIPRPSQQPFYVKLRAEADEGLLKNGNGNLYLGFLLDPLYEVHWNNLAAPIKFRFDAAGKVELSPDSGAGPKVEQPADVDPREFLVAIKRNEENATAPLRLKVDYYACHDGEGWCKHVVQEYEIQLVVDRDGGWVQSRRKAAQRPMAGGQPKNNPPRPMGTIVKVEADVRKLTMQLRTGRERTVHVDEQATIEYNGVEATLADLKAGDHITVDIKRPVDEREPVVLRIVAEKP